ncbi:L-aspartate oxidase [Rhodococcus rhodnii]|uniref:L-aspartate oxidase n=2 Tax=Rhodococcus rhodnii TaxID=38312 RepID=R7WTK1_9NOCA|nr:L-aspartate oxidase [Rhodococcus rhodnii]EOM78587.1 L-aspartate oxidase [Rhodococcus rhodnii LMG 5362]TXG91368.1 L-aspartate oxidase [Rhodococcus rhodnii]
MTGRAASCAWERAADLVVVGGGAAGLAAACEAAERGLRVLVLVKSGDTATRLAQGGLAAVLPGGDPGDSLASHAADTHAAGDGHCDDGAVRTIVAEGASVVDLLVRRGARFDGGDLAPYLTREGGHSARRIVHAGGDATGVEIQRTLSAAAHAAQGVTVVEDVAVLRVLTGPRGVAGVLAVSHDGLGVVHAPAVLLATGGIGALYEVGTNPETATGDGIALALDAGARVADLEFVQFHPTALVVPDARGRSPLVSEALRGEGAVLVGLDGARVTAGVHPLGDLAPRDVVARAVTAHMHSTGARHVLLDATAVHDVAQRFPTVTAACRGIGIDPATDPIPVAAAAHYACGGVVADTHGRTDVRGLYAAGEVACTGLHGANRLASNSLLEAVAVGRRAGRAATERLAAVGETRRDVTDAALPRRRVLARTLVQSLATEFAGVRRTGSGLAELAAVVESAPLREISTLRGAEDAALTTTAHAIALAAAERTETRGCHARTDHPGRDDALAHRITVARRGDDLVVGRSTDHLGVAS